jgi:NMD protein affecting ribosome stability and mRNA decay
MSRLRRKMKCCRCGQEYEEFLVLLRDGGGPYVSHLCPSCAKKDVNFGRIYDEE